MLTFLYLLQAKFIEDLLVMDDMDNNPDMTVRYDLNSRKTWLAFRKDSFSPGHLKFLGFLRIPKQGRWNI